jgi:hypothetical protein
MRYRIVKLTKLSADCCWAIQKRFRNWLTGKYVWKYYDSDWERIGWTRNVNWAKQFFTEEAAENEVAQLIKYDHDSIVEITVVKEIKVDDACNIQINPSIYG